MVSSCGAIAWEIQLERLVNSLSDNELLSRVRKGDAQAFGEIYERHVGVLMGTISRVLKKRSEAEEVLQDVFTLLWQKSQKFDEKKGSLRSWLLTIGRNRAIDRMRNKNYQAGQYDFEDGPLQYVASDEASPLDLEVLRQQKSKVQNVLAGLGEEQRQALELCFYEGLTHKEAAEKLGVPLGTLKTRVRLGLQKLAGELKGVAA